MPVVMSLVAIGLIVAAALAGRAGPRGRGAGQLPVLDGSGVIAGFALSVLAGLILGPINGLALPLALVLHELGRVLALRALGLGPARIRLAALPWGPAPLDRRPETDRDQAFLALMGPALSMGPMLAMIALAMGLSSAGLGGAAFAWSLATTIALLNLAVLLPVPQFDGRQLLDAIAPALGTARVRLAALALCAALGLAWLSGQTALVLPLVAVGCGAVLAWRPEPTGRIGLSHPEARLIAAAHASALAAYFVALAYLVAQVA
jgi:Zn-dependent protease